VLLAQVEGFVEVARLGSLSRAASELHVTQPALTARLQGLEDELGSRLFVRSRRGLELTASGRAFLPYAERALASLREGGQLVADLEQGGAGELRIGAAPAVSTYVLPALLVRFTSRHPRVRLIVRTGHSEEILELTLRREIEVGLVRELRHPAIEALPLYEDDVVLVAEPRMMFALARQIPVERIREARLILFDRTSSYYDLANAIVRAAGVSPRGVMELDNIDAAKHMVLAGLGVALLPATAVADEVTSGELSIVRLIGTAPIRRRIVAIRRNDVEAPSANLAAFYAVLKEIDEVLPKPR